MSMIQVNLAHAFNLRVVINKEVATFGLKRGVNWVDASLRETPEWKALISRIELPIEAVQAQLENPAMGISGGITVNSDLAVRQAKENAERAKAEAAAQKKFQDEAEQKAKDEAASLEKIQEEEQAQEQMKRRKRGG